MSTAWQAAGALLSLGATAAVGVGIGLRRPPQAGAWLLVGACLAAFAAGDLIALVADPSGGPGRLDLVRLAGYPALVVGLHVMHRRGDRAADRAGLVDAAIVAVTAGLAGWVVVVGPLMGPATGADRAVLLAYFGLDVAVLAVATRLVVRGPTRVVPSLLALGVAALLAGDVAHLRTWPGGADGSAGLSGSVQVAWLAASVLLAAAAVHPGVRQAVATATTRRETLSRVRLALLGVMVLIAPALMGLQAARGEYDDIAGLAVGLGVLLALVIVRVGLLMSDVTGTAARERTLRLAAAEFVAAGDRPGVHAAALRALERLGAAEVLASRIVDATASEDLELVAGDGPGVAGVRSRSLAPSLLPYVGSGTAFRPVTLAELDEDVVAALGLQGLDGQVRVFPVRVHGEPLAVVVLVVSQPLQPGALDAVETLVAQLALALESVTLADDRHVRRSEARFRALVQNSSDAILLLGRDAAVSYQSPSADGMFGYDAGELVGHHVEDLCHPDDLPRLRSGLSEVLAVPGLTRRLELRLRRRGGGWLDAEAAVTNLHHDPNVRASVVTIRDVSERKRFELQLTHQAFHDELTGLANRALFVDRVAHALARRERDSTGLAVLLLDLDDFKTVNDGLGHAAGDAMLRAVADRLATLVRPGDTTARLGGDEFAMVLVDLPSEQAAVHAVERIMTVLGQPLVIEGKEIFARCSIGIAFAGDLGGFLVTPDQLLRNADAAMYVVKTDGKGRYAVYQPHMHAAALHRLDLRADLQRALDNDEFVLHYQPIVSMESGALVGVEALVRWVHPKRGIVAPGAFIPLAEETGLVVPLGLWVLEKACQQVATWSTANPGLSVSVNVSQRQLRRREFGAEVGSVLARTGIEPSRIALEITESAVMAEVESTIERLRDLKELGVRVAVDDFGTGYSSFSWLRQLPVDVLKIDKEFIDELGRREQGGFLVAAIIDLAHNLGLRTVAEGIERPLQLTRLKDLRCDLGQGFHLGRPMPAPDVLDLLALERSREAAAGVGPAGRLTADPGWRSMAIGSERDGTG